jgi:hypothetical protein
MQFGGSGETSGRGQWCLHHDNSSSHTPLAVQQILAEKNIAAINQSPKDLALSGFWLIPTLKMGLKGT